MSEMITLQQVLDESGAPLIIDGQQLYQTQNGDLVYMPAECQGEGEVFDQQATESDRTSVPLLKSSEESSHAPTTKDKRVKWARGAILSLIKYRKELDGRFKSTNVKNEQVWKELSAKMIKAGHQFNSTQCNDKWKYLKSKYTSRKDNMGAKGTGESPVDFEYFDEMDAFLGRNHSIAPIAIASSSRPEITTGEEETNPLPCIVYVHGESFEWNSGNPYDGTVLASNGRVIVVTINFRLGVLGFLKTGTKGSAQGNFGLMDLVAGLHWLRENLPAFGGDPERVTLMGHGTGAALVNFIAVSPVAKELLHRVILLSGSGLSPWALQRDPLSIKRTVAQQTDCHGHLEEDDLAPCLRKKPLNHLLSVKVDTPRFLPGFAPFIDGTILLNPTSAPPTSSTSTVATSAGYELADFPERDLLFGLTSTESYLDLNAQDLKFGFNETRRDRILRTYVRNAYYYHLNEIFSTLKNEYTDWERPSQNLLSIRDATLDVLSDGHTAAPLIRVGYLHSMRGGRTFFLHFQHQNGERDWPMRSGSVRGDDLAYILGLPLLTGGSFFPHNYSHSDVTVSKTLIHYISNFARKGDPNGAVPNASASEAKNTQKGHEDLNTPYWDTYDTINQLYLELGNRPEMRNHYRGHKMSLWLNLIPQLHRPGEGDDVSMRHHHFQEEEDQYYDGSVRPQTKERPPLIHVIVPPPPATTMRIPPATTSPPPPPPKSDTALQATTTECPPNNTVLPSVTRNNNLLKKLASSHYQSYTTALTVTIAVGCFLLLLNIVIFAGIYHQRDRDKKKRKKKEELAEAGSCSSSSGENYDKAFESRQISYDVGVSFKTNYLGEFSCDKRMLADVQMTELPLQEFKSSPPPAKRIEANHPPDVTTSTNNQEKLGSPSIPEPPPPPKGQPPGNQAGILRAQGTPNTPGTMKKRVQIQEISV